MTSLTNRSILVVEDDAALRHLLARRLQHAGCRVVECASGDAAVHLCREHDVAFDLMICDMVMPGMTGAEAAKRIADARPGMPIVIMSGYMQDDAMAEACAGPGRYFLEKPFEAETLAALLDRVFTAAASTAA
ncbi:MAG TPA: response regulator [Gemmatimonadaceae bacterium]|nr:response regulator [Gemmatimonadaceae bacterium]